MSVVAQNTAIVGDVSGWYVGLSGVRGIQVGSVEAQQGDLSLSSLGDVAYSGRLTANNINLHGNNVFALPAQYSGDGGTKGSLVTWGRVKVTANQDAILGDISSEAINVHAKNGALVVGNLLTSGGDVQLKGEKSIDIQGDGSYGYGYFTAESNGDIRYNDLTAYHVKMSGKNVTANTVADQFGERRSSLATSAGIDITANRDATFGKLSSRGRDISLSAGGDLSFAGDVTTWGNVAITARNIESLYGGDMNRRSLVRAGGRVDIAAAETATLGHVHGSAVRVTDKRGDVPFSK